MHVALLTSPCAGGGAAARVAGTAASVLRGYGHTVEPLVGADAAGAARAAQAAVAARADAVLVLGGDGLAHCALQAVAGTGTAFGVLPAGSGNDLARALGMPADPVAAARALGELDAGAAVPMDLGRIASATWFATVACTGFDAAVSARAGRIRGLSGRRRYDAAILAELVSFRPRPVAVQAGGTTLHTDATLVAVGNTAYYGSGIPVCPEADPCDGALEVTVVGAAPRRELVRLLPSLRTGRHVHHPAVTTLRAREVYLSGQYEWPCYADGEPQARLPLRIRAEAGALRVLLPRGAAGVPRHAAV